MPDELTPDERAALAKSLARRCRKVADICDSPHFLEHPGAQDTLIAAYGWQMMVGLMRLGGDQLRDGWLTWLGQKTRNDYGLCYCGKSKNALADVLCEDCRISCEQMEEELALEELRAMPAATDAKTRDEELTDIARNPDSRD